MKKYLLAVGVVALLVTGCGNNEPTSEELEVVKGIAKELAVASANNDNDKMVQYGNALMRQNAMPKEILVKDNCHEVIYYYMGQQESAEYCK